MDCDVPEEQLWSWIDRDAAELEPHLAQCPRCRAMAEELRAGIKTVADGSMPVGASLPGKIGSYVITGLLGEGGQALVYKAEQQTPQRAVAVKVLKGGRCVGEQDVRHFQREIQTLAAVSHPAIATIYEGGQTAEGQHFFAMELVDGVPLDRYARERNLPLGERLELFCKVCEGVQYAHERGVIHRDLKPANILVVEEGTEARSRRRPSREPEGGTKGSSGGATGAPPVAPGGRDAHPTVSGVSGAIGQPKILDFGLARLMNTDVTLTQTATQTGQIMGTLRYMSPGQARGDPAEIDERSDGYSLSVILYELLTDRPPYELSNVIPEAVRTICETPPRRPSSTLGWDGRPARHLRGDLETIVLKALEKEPARRYPSVADLTADVQRYLKGEPIRARPASRLYVIRKRLRQHRRVVVAVVGVAVLVLATIFAGLWWRQRALNEETLRLTSECMLRARAGQWQQALAACTAIIEGKRHLPDTGAFRLRADIHVALRQYDRAIADYTAGSKLIPNNPWYYYLRATPLWIAGRRADAAEDYRMFRKLSPGVSYADARLFLVLRDEARVLGEQGRVREAEALVQEADGVLRAARRVVKQGTWLAEIVACLAGDDEPEALVTGAREGNPKRRCEAWFYGAECCLLRERLDQAREWYQHAAATDLVFDPEAPSPAAMAEYHLAVWRLRQLGVQERPASDPTR